MELFLKGGVWGVVPKKFEHESVKNPAIIDTSNEFIALYIEVHSGVTIRWGCTSLKYMYP